MSDMSEETGFMTGNRLLVVESINSIFNTYQLKSHSTDSYNIQLIEKRAKEVA